MLSPTRHASDCLRANRESRAFHETAWRYRQTINDEYAGPRLQAAIRASQSFMPRSFWPTYLGSHDELLPFYEAETAAIRPTTPTAARAACAGRAEVMGRIMLAELVRAACSTHRPWPGRPRLRSE